MEVNKDQPNENTIDSAPAVARESATVMLFSETQRQIGEWERLVVNKRKALGLLDWRLVARGSRLRAN